MMRVSDLAQHILSFDPQKNPARLAFYHFLKNMLPLDMHFGQESIDIFYDRALTMQYWQTNKDALGQLIKEDLTSISSRHSFGFDLDQIVHAHELQFLTIDHSRDFAALLSQDVAQMEKQGEKVKTFRLTQDKPGRPMEVLFVRLKPSGQVVAEIRQNLAFIVDGGLQLIRPHSRLIYTADLDFEPNVDQFLTTSLMKVARFQSTGRDGLILNGDFIQGASFHRSESFERPADRVPELFQAIKSVERYFINPVTDPYYQKMIEKFEQVINEKSQF